MSSQIIADAHGFDVSYFVNLDGLVSGVPPATLYYAESGTTYLGRGGWPRGCKTRHDLPRVQTVI